MFVVSFLSILKKTPGRQVACIIAAFAFAALCAAPSLADAATYTWDGGGVDTNWSTCANWSSDTCPLSSDSVIFAASSTKNATIDTDITVSGFSINSGYTGTVGPAAGQLITVTGAFVQGAGTFVASQATTSFSGSFTYTAGTFGHNSGTVKFNNPGASQALTPDSVQFNNVVFDMPGNIASASYTTSLGSNMTVLGNLVFQNTNTNAGFYTFRSSSTATRTVAVAGHLLFPPTSSSASLFAGSTGGGNPIMIDLQGDFSVSDSGAGVYFDISFASSSNQAISRTNGTIASYSDWYDTGAGNLTLASDFSGAQVLHPDGETDFNFAANPYTFTSGSVTLSPGDVFSPAGAAVFAYSTKVTLSAGTFNSPNNSVFNGGLEITGGTFNAPSGTTTVRTVLSYEGFVFTSGTFDHGGGTMLFDLPSVGMTIAPNAANLNNVIIDFTTSAGGSTYASIGSNMSILGNMTVQSNQPSTGLLTVRSSVLGTPRSISVAGDFVIASTTPSTATVFLGDSSGSNYALTFTLNGNVGIYDSSTVYADVILAGSGNQTVSRPAGSISASSDWTVNKSSGFMALGSAFSTSGTVAVATGTLKTAGFGLTTAVSGLSVGAAGNLQIQGGEAVSTSTFAVGGTMTYDGTSGPYTLKNFSYKNLTIQGSGATFNTPAALTIAGNLHIASGTLDVTGGSFALQVSGNWLNTGTFTPRAGTVTLNGTNQSVTGTTTFYNLTKSVVSADTLTFGAGQTQTVTNTWVANGASNNLLSLRSSVTGTRWRIDPQGTRTLSYIDVKDSNNINASAIGEVTGIVNSLNNLNWGFDVTAPVASSIVITPAATTALVAWNTDEAATSTLIYGLTSSYDLTSTSSGTSTHSVTLSGLVPGTTYHYAIVSTDPTGNQSTTTDATFVTAEISAESGGGTSSSVVPGSQTGVSGFTSYEELILIFGDKAIRPPVFAAGNNAPAQNIVHNEVKQAPIRAFIRKDAKIGDLSPEVRMIQQILNRNPETAVAKIGIGSAGKETMYFGPATKAAVQKFQIRYNLVKDAKDPGYGRVGPKTRARMNAE